MSTNAIGSAPTADPAMQKLVDRIDADHDGKITTKEFVSFLSELMNDVGARQVNDGTPQAPADTPPGASLLPPSSWSDNNAPYGVTFAGFSPQDHTDLSVADLSNPLNAKYAVYDYLLSNRVGADATWAYGAADALNKQLGTTVFKAIDGETLGYGDEYVHSAPNGYGMARGTFNPAANGEFFWGAE